VFQQCSALAIDALAPTPEYTATTLCIPFATHVHLVSNLGIGWRSMPQLDPSSIAFQIQHTQLMSDGFTATMTFALFESLEQSNTFAAPLASSPSIILSPAAPGIVDGANLATNGGTARLSGAFAVISMEHNQLDVFPQTQAMTTTSLASDPFASTRQHRLVFVVHA